MDPSLEKRKSNILVAQDALERRVNERMSMGRSAMLLVQLSL
jgi:hypothetical protein